MATTQEADEEWWEEVDPESLEAAFQHIAQAEGALTAALEELDGRGGLHRDRLAKALNRVAFEKTAFDGARTLATEEE